MGFRFRKTFKIGSGFKFHISKTGFSSTIGGKGLSINTGSHGTFLNTGISGTGISYRTKLFKTGHRIKSKKRLMNTDNLTKKQVKQDNEILKLEAKEQHERYITQIAKKSASNVHIPKVHKILIYVIGGMTLIALALGFYIIMDMNKKLEHRRAERLRLENPQKVFQEEKNKNF